MAKSKYMLFSVFILSVFLCLSLLVSPKAEAALEGEDGRVLLVEGGVNTESSTIGTMQPDGSNYVPIVQETTYDTNLSTATVSNPNQNGDYSISYATEQCNELGYITIEGTSCYSSDAAINKVDIDSNGNVISSPQKIVDLEPISIPADEVPPTDYNWAYEMSYSPNDQNVLVAQAGSYAGNGFSVNPESEVSTLERPIILTKLLVVDVNTGAITNITNPSNDDTLSGGYADNGNIYYSKENTIFVIPNGSSFAQEVPGTAEDTIVDFYIDISPDNKDILVADLSSEGCYYNQFVLGYNDTPGICDYYYIDSTTGASTKLEELNYLFAPRFFSPSNEYLVGTLYDENQIYSNRAFGLTAFSFETLDVTTRPATAIVYRNNLSVAYAVSDRIGVQEWAPLAVNNLTTTPKVIATSAVTLPDTGLNSQLVLTFVIVLLASGSIVLVSSKK